MKGLCDRRGVAFDPGAVFDAHAYKEAQYDLLAKTTREALDMNLIYKILEAGV